MAIRARVAILAYQRHIEPISGEASPSVIRGYMAIRARVAILAYQGHVEPINGMTSPRVVI